MLSLPVRSIRDQVTSEPNRVLDDKHLISRSYDRASVVPMEGQVHVFLQRPCSGLVTALLAMDSILVADNCGVTGGDIVAVLTVTYGKNEISVEFTRRAWYTTTYAQWLTHFFVQIHKRLNQFNLRCH